MHNKEKQYLGKITKEFFEAVKMEDLIAIIKNLRSRPDLSNAKDKLQRTPLHGVAKRGFDKIAYILLDFGAKALSVDHLGRTPRDLALNKGN